MGVFEMTPMSKRSGSVERLDQLKFGKKMMFGHRLTNDEVLEDHLMNIKLKKESTHYEKDSRQKEERDRLAGIAKEMEEEKLHKIRHSQVLRNEFLFFND
jgi:uncharacterized protein YpbB